MNNGSCNWPHAWVFIGCWWHQEPDYKHQNCSWCDYASWTTRRKCSWMCAWPDPKVCLHCWAPSCKNNGSLLIEYNSFARVWNQLLWTLKAIKYTSQLLTAPQMKMTSGTPQEVFCIPSFEQHLLENDLQMLNDELQEYIPSYLTVILGWRSHNQYQGQSDSLEFGNVDCVQWTGLYEIWSMQFSESVRKMLMFSFHPLSLGPPSLLVGFRDVYLYNGPRIKQWANWCC